jgi:hypothetical protein
MASQLYSFNSSDNSVTKFFSGNIAAYYLNGNSLSYMILSPNYFDGSVANKDLYTFSGFIGKKGENSIVFLSQFSGGIIAFSDENAINIKVSPSCRYILVKYNNGVHKLFRFNKKIMAFESFTYFEALPSGGYYFMGDNKLLRISKTAAVYKIIEDKSEIQFKKTGYASGNFNIKEKINQTNADISFTVKTEAA